jgi:NDP-sugar pyrophosphorylase family protein
MTDTNEIAVVILAGGSGSRLRPVVADKPKVLAQVSGRPFLTFILDQLEKAALNNVIISTGYRAEDIEESLGKTRGPLKIRYSKEDTPLGTAGALRLALEQIESNPVMVMNGDSFINADLAEYAQWFRAKDAAAAMILKQVPDTSRYGRVDLDEEKRIVAFREKGDMKGPGWINAGVYILRKELIHAIEPGKQYSLERDFFPALAGKEFFGYCIEAEFLDIGTPQSYAGADEFFRSTRKDL